MINEFEAIFIVECIRSLGWQLKLNDRMPSEQIVMVFRQCVSKFKFPKEFKDHCSNKSKTINKNEAEQTFFNIFLICYSMKNFLNQRYTMNILELYLEDELNKADKSEGFFSFIMFINDYLKANWFYFDGLIKNISIKKANDIINDITSKPIQEYTYESEKLPIASDRLGYEEFQSAFIPTNVDFRKFENNKMDNEAQKNINFVARAHQSNINIYQNQPTNIGYQAYGTNMTDVQNPNQNYNTNYQDTLLMRQASQFTQTNNNFNQTFENPRLPNPQNIQRVNPNMINDFNQNFRMHNMVKFFITFLIIKLSFNQMTSDLKFIQTLETQAKFKLKIIAHSTKMLIQHT